MFLADKHNLTELHIESPKQKVGRSEFPHPMWRNAHGEFPSGYPSLGSWLQAHDKMVEAGLMAPFLGAVGTFELYSLWLFFKGWAPRLPFLFVPPFIFVLLFFFFYYEAQKGLFFVPSQMAELVCGKSWGTPKCPVCVFAVFCLPRNQGEKDALANDTSKCAMVKRLVCWGCWDDHQAHSWMWFPNQDTTQHTGKWET